MFTLPDDLTVYPGHFEPTTIGYEKKNNPFLKYENVTIS
jgi:glyoxylase-like metal-dependent hydrolase (beta-lactamase superfamily II)